MYGGSDTRAAIDGGPEREPDATHKGAVDMMFWNIARQLHDVHGALDDALGDTDVTHLSDAELREQYPAQWATEKLATLIQKLEALDMESIPEVKIVVNGLPFNIRPPEHMVTYEQIALLAGHPDDKSLTITYEIFPPWRAKRTGTLRPGRSIDVEDGMIFNAVRTDDA